MPHDSASKSTDTIGPTKKEKETLKRKGNSNARKKKEKTFVGMCLLFGCKDKLGKEEVKEPKEQMGKPQSFTHFLKNDSILFVSSQLETFDMDATITSSI